MKEHVVPPTDDERVELCRQEIADAVNKAMLPASVLCLILENILAQIRLQELGSRRPQVQPGPDGAGKE